MAINLVSPGVSIREVDLTIGSINTSNRQVGVIAGPFQRGPINVPVLVQSEQDLLNFFGKPQKEGEQYEYWLSASSYLAYGGVLRVIRTDNESNPNSLSNAVSGVTTYLKIKSLDDFNNNHVNDTTWNYAARNPGTWGNGLKVCTIDAFADQIISGINTTTGVGVHVGDIATQYFTRTYAGVGTVSTYTGRLRGLITGVGNSSIYVKITDQVDASGNSTVTNYSNPGIGTNVNAFTSPVGVSTIVVSGLTTTSTVSYTTAKVSDWYDSQTLGLTNSTIYWNSVAPKPGTSQYASERSSKNDEIHIVVVDDSGVVTGTPGTILERFIGMSKALDGRVSPSQNVYYKDYITNSSKYVFPGTEPSSDEVVSGIIPGNSYSTYTLASGGGWNQNTDGIIFNTTGPITYSLINGRDYSGVNYVGGYDIELSDILTSYSVVKNPAEYAVDFIICGSPGGDLYTAQAKANYLISIAESRKDCIVTISPNRASLVNVPNSDEQTNNLLQFFGPISSSSYAVLSSGYKYTYDRFNNAFQYVPCDGDIAGLMARTTDTSYSWYSPAGSQRGVLKNVVKLAYNPSQTQRDLLYANRINPVIADPNSGVILYGDKTALSYSSAFDRINVRRLFLTLEKVVEGAARGQLFEFNDIITRTNFINIVDPYLRDVKSKRGITDYLLVCDETNNTPDVIDSDNFRADIYIKPARSINYVGLTFVSTRTGASFTEIVGTV